jgi:hypothetical protein
MRSTVLALAILTHIAPFAMAQNTEVTGQVGGQLSGLELS